MFKIKKLIINIAVIVLNILYLPFKLFRTKNKVTYISRQSNTPSLDFMLLKEELEKLEPNVQQIMLTKKIGKGIKGKIIYGIHIFSQMYHIATSKVVVVDTYIIPVSVLKHKKSLKVIQIWHALGAIKKFGYQILDKKEGSSRAVALSMRMHKNYDAVTASSHVTAKFYSEAFNTDISKIKVIGMPRVDYIKSTDKSKEILELNPEYLGKKTIIYIPTFRKNKSIDLTEVISNTDLDKFNLIIKLHPLDNTKVEDKYVAKGNFSTYDLMSFADYIITDYSAVAIEASVLNKPLFLYVYDIEEYGNNRGLNVELTKELKSSTSKSYKDIMKIIQEGTYNFDELTKFKNKYVETFDENNTENVCKLIIEYLKN